MQTSSHQALVIAVILLSGYSLGANCVERFVNYQTWHLIPATAFKAYHRAQQPLIQIFVVAPLAVGTILQLWLAFRASPGLSHWVVWVMVAASLAGFLSTVMAQLPVHTAFNKNGYTPDGMRRLLHTDWWRKAADVVRMVATVVLLHQILNGR